MSDRPHDMIQPYPWQVDIPDGTVLEQLKFMIEWAVRVKPHNRNVYRAWQEHIANFVIENLDRLY